jgi:thiamine biosynthesis lipoprotein
MVQAYRFSFSTMGSPCELQIYAEIHTVAERVVNLAMADLRRIEARYSRYPDDSITSRINRIAASGSCITVDEETGSSGSLRHERY